MINFWSHRLFNQTWHPAFEELTAYLDGEKGPAAARIAAHAKTCWSCRASLETIDRTISEYMEARKIVLGDSPVFPVGRLAGFTDRLERLEAESGRPRSRFARLVRNCTHRPDLHRPDIHRLGLSLVSPVVPVFLVLLFFISIYWLRFASAPTVSAKEILSQVRQAEVAEITKVAAPVIHTRLQLRRSSGTRQDTITWEIWNDLWNNRLRQSVRDSTTRSGSAATPEGFALEEMKQQFRSHQADVGRPLSCSNYERWRDSIRQVSEEVVDGRLPNGDRATILKASGKGPFAPGSVVRSELTVRTTDWHPVAQTIFVQRQAELVVYSLGELAFDVISLGAVPPSVLAEPAPASTPDMVLSGARPTQAPAPGNLLVPDGHIAPTEAELRAAEVEVWYALHSAKACTGRPVAVRLTEGGITVEGVVDNDDRKQAILVSLRGIPHVMPGVRTVDEQTAGAAENATVEPALLPVDPVSVERPGTALPIEELLRKHFSASVCAGRDRSGIGTCVQAEIANLSQQTLSQAESAQAEAWALRRLASWDTFAKIEDLRISTRRLLELMVRDHLNALRSALDTLRAQLKPIISTQPVGNSSGMECRPAATSDRQGEGVPAALLRLFSAVEKTTDLTIGIFAQSNRQVDQPEQALKDLSSKLDGLARELTNLQAELSGDPFGLQDQILGSRR